MPSATKVRFKSMMPSQCIEEAGHAWLGTGFVYDALGSRDVFPENVFPALHVRIDNLLLLLGVVLFLFFLVP